MIDASTFQQGIANICEEIKKIERVILSGTLQDMETYKAMTYQIIGLQAAINIMLNASHQTKLYWDEEQ